MPIATRLCSPLVAALLLSAAAAAAAQQPAPTPSNAQTEPSSRTINLDVVATRKPGEPVTGLQQSDFTILDDKIQQPITAFHAFSGSEEPLEVVVLIDSVNTDFNVVAQDRIGIERFLKANGGTLAHPTTLAVLTNKGLQMQQGSYTRDGNALAASLDKYTIGLRTVGRSGGFVGAAERVDDSLKALQVLTVYESARPGRKIILWISPGWPLLSGPGVNLTSKQEHGIFDQIVWLSAKLREAQTTIYSVNPLGPNESLGNVFYYQQFVAGVKKPGDSQTGNLALQVLATQTGGLVLNSSDVAQQLGECVEDAGAYYRISFEPPVAEHKDVYHRLEVKVSKPGVTARTSTGYYAEP
jgi:VWFA-related protein